MKSKVKISAAFKILDDWFDCAQKRDPRVGGQIQGAHAALAWVLGIEIPNSHDFEDNLTMLAEELDRHGKAVQ